MDETEKPQSFNYSGGFGARYGSYSTNVPMGAADTPASAGI